MRKLSILVLAIAISVMCALPAFSLEDENSSPKHINIAELHNQSSSRWTQVYHTARNEDIRVDVEIMIPDVQQFPCIEAIYNSPSDELPVTKKNGLAVSTEDFEYVNEIDGHFLIAIPGDDNKLKMEKKAKKQGIYRDMFIYSRKLQLSAGEFDLHTAYAVNNPMTIDDITSRLNAYTEKYFPGRNIQWVPAFMEAGNDTKSYEYNKKTGEYEIIKDTPDFEGVLSAEYNQLLYGIPVLGWPYEGFSRCLTDNRMKGEEMGMMGARASMCTMKYLGSDDISFDMSLILLSTQSILQEDIPLAPVSTIISSAEEFILSEKLRRIDSFRLGYVAWRKNDKEFLLMPTWAIEGEVFSDADAEHKYPDDFYGHRDYAAEYQKLYINAQTGEIINPWQTDNNRSYKAPALLSWKDVID